MADLSTFRTRVGQILKHSAGIANTSAELDANIAEAVRQYTRDKPRIVDQKLTGDGSAQEFAVPSLWQENFSTIIHIEFPIDRVPIETLENEDDYQVVQRDNADLIQMPSVTLGSGEEARVKYRTIHTVTASASTIPGIDFDAVCNLAASFHADTLAGFYAETTEPTLDVDVVNHLGKADAFAAISDRLKAKYVEHITDGDVEKAALLLSDMDISLTWGRDTLFPRRRDR